MRITTLSENTAGRLDMEAEWGLSILVETGKSRVLLDGGQGHAAVHNAQALGVDIRHLDAIVLSHGHRDHTGGLRWVLWKSGPTPVIGHPQVMVSRYAKLPNGSHQEVGMPYPRAELEGMGARLQLGSEPVKLSDEIMTTGEIPLNDEYESVDSNLFLKEHREYLPDTIPDDQALMVQSEEGLVVVTGCAHRGLINTLRRARKLTGQDVYMAIGGAHLLHASEERVLLTVAALQEMGVKRIGVSHCTGLPAAAIMSHQLGERFFFNMAGTVVTVGK